MFVRSRTGRDLQLLCTLARKPLLALEALAFVAQGLPLNAALRLAGRKSRGARFDLAQLRKDLFKMRPSLCERGVRGQLSLLCPLEIGQERSETLFKAADRLNQQFPLLQHALSVLGSLRGLPFERFATRKRSRVLRFDARDFAARALCLRAQLFELQFAAVMLRPQPSNVLAEGRRLGGGGRALFFAPFELGMQGRSFGTPGSAGPQVREDLQIAHARAYAPVALRAPKRRIEFGNSALQLRDEVADANRILLRALETPQRLMLAREKLADACSLFEEGAPVGRFAGEDRVDLTLRNDRVRAGTEPRSHDEIEDVAQAHLAAVDEVLALADAIGAPGDLHFVKVDWQTAVSVVEENRDLG